MNDLYGSTLGLVGYGSLGHGMQKLAEAFGMKVVIAEHKNATTIREGHMPFDSVLREADVVSLHTPLTAETRHMIAAREFGLMKPTAILINTARGNLGGRGSAGRGAEIAAHRRRRFRRAISGTAA